MNPSIELPKQIEIEPTLTCNLRCRMCHVSYMDHTSQPVFPASLIDRLPSLDGTGILLGANFEPTMNRDFPGIIRKLTERGVNIDLITNGTLLDREIIDALAEANVRLMTISFDGIRKETYEHIRRRAKYEETIERVLALKQRLPATTYWALNSTIMRRNMDELQETAEFWDGHGFDQIRFINMVVRNDAPELVKESLFPVLDQFHRNLDAVAEDVLTRRRKVSIANPWFNTSPLRQKYPAKNMFGPVVISDNPAARHVPELRGHYQLGAGPGMRFPCKSPWTFARILPSGDVDLCYKFVVGNLHEQSFADIWFGERAQAVRAKVVDDTDICHKCDYFRFCLNGANIDDSKRTNAVCGSLLEHVDDIDFVTGNGSRKPMPILVTCLEGYNIVRLGERILVVPQSIGPIELDKVDLAEFPQIVSVDSLQSAYRTAKQLADGANIDDSKRTNAAYDSLVEHVDDIDFETGNGSGRPIPILVTCLEGYNIVRLGERFLVVPQSIGPIELDKVDLAEFPQIVSVDSLQSASRTAKQLAAG